MDDIKSKLRHYKTAWSRLYNSYISIVRTYDDAGGEPIIVGCVPGSEEEPELEVLFRVCELSNFCV